MILIDTILQGVMLGGLYALFALGLSLTFGVMRLVNLAHGDLILLGAYIILTLSGSLYLPPLIAALAALPVMFVVGWALQRYVLNRTLQEDILPPLIVTFGLSILMCVTCWHSIAVSVSPDACDSLSGRYRACEQPRYDLWASHFGVST